VVFAHIEEVKATKTVLVLECAGSHIKRYGACAFAAAVVAGH
jgi:hypothetical protein